MIRLQIFLLLGLSLVLPPQRLHKIDLTAEARTGALTARGGGSCNTWMEGEHLEAPLRVDLDGFGESRYRLSEPVRYSVRIANAGNSDVVFPSQRPDPDVPPDQGIQAAIRLNADVAGSEPVTFGNVLGGSSRIPGSLLTLKPGDAVRVLLSGRIHFEPWSAPRIKEVVGKPLPVRAEVRLQVAPCRWAAANVSENSLRIVFSR